MTCRRHHCRQCGELFCYRCCSSKALLQPGSGTPVEARVGAHPIFGATETAQDKPQKVCGKCFELLLPMQPFLASTSSKAVQVPRGAAGAVWRGGARRVRWAGAARRGAGVWVGVAGGVGLAQSAALRESSPPADTLCSRDSRPTSRRRRTPSASS